MARTAVQLIRRRWRVWLRALHRDAGYLAIGLTVIYAVSGIAINHVDSWDSDFESIERTVDLPIPLPVEDKALVALAKSKLDIREQPVDVYRGELEFEISFEGQHTVRIDLTTGQAFQDYQEPRFFLRAANWLHRNRGKAAWTFIADGYAVFLLFLAFSGVFMLKGKKGFVGRGVILIVLGSLVPLLYVQFSGGP